MSDVNLKDAEQGSPEWWLRTLLAQLEARRPEYVLWNDYYENKHPLNFFDDAVRERFGFRFRRFASNYCALVVEGLAERLEVQGFRFTDPEGDEDVWAIWQENNLDAWSQSAHIDSLVKGCAYTLVDPNNGDPRITVEDALDCIVAHDPRDNRRRLAGLKRWIDPSDGRLMVVVYMADAIYKYRSKQAWPSNVSGQWLAPYLGPTWSINSTVPGDWSVYPSATSEGLSPMLPDIPAGGLEEYQPAGDDEWPLSNSLGVVPLIRLPNRPRLSGQFANGRSEIQPISSNQDAINYFRAMAVIAGRYLAMPQRYAVNLETETDEKTGQPKAPFKGGLADLWVVPPMDEDDPRAYQAQTQTMFGQFAPADLRPYLDIIEREVVTIASITRMPYYYLMGQPTSVPPSGESLNSSEAALVRKNKTTRIFIGEGWEETMRVALKAKNDARSENRQAETIWASPETRNLAVVTDAVVKQRADGLIDYETAREVLGYSPQQRRRIRASIPDWAEVLTPDENTMILAQMNAGLITADEARTAAKLPKMTWPEGLAKEDVELLVTQVKEGLLTHDEARKQMGMGPIEYSTDLGAEEIASLIAQVTAGLITYDEARKKLGLGPIDYGTDPSEDEIKVLVAQIDAGLLTVEEARKDMGREPIKWPEDLSDKIEQAARLINAGFDPAAVMTALDLPKIKHLGLPPVTVQKIADAEGVLPEGKGDPPPVNPPLPIPPNPNVPAPPDGSKPPSQGGPPVVVPGQPTPPPGSNAPKPPPTPIGNRAPTPTASDTSSPKPPAKPGTGQQEG